jgi:hypothetical protein
VFEFLRKKNWHLLFKVGFSEWTISLLTVKLPRPNPSKTFHIITSNNLTIPLLLMTVNLPVQEDLEELQIFCKSTWPWPQRFHWMSDWVLLFYEWHKKIHFEFRSSNSPQLETCWHCLNCLVETFSKTFVWHTIHWSVAIDPTIIKKHCTYCN